MFIYFFIVPLLFTYIMTENKEHIFNRYFNVKREEHIEEGKSDLEANEIAFKEMLVYQKNSNRNGTLYGSTFIAR